MTDPFSVTIKSIRFDEGYCPAENTRITTNFANLARGEARQQNLRNALDMIENRLNALADWDKPGRRSLWHRAGDHLGRDERFRK